MLAILLALLVQTASANPFTPPHNPESPEPIVIITVQTPAGEMRCVIFQGASTGYCLSNPVNFADPMGFDARPNPGATPPAQPAPYRGPPRPGIEVQPHSDEEIAGLEAQKTPLIGGFLSWVPGTDNWDIDAEIYAKKIANQNWYAGKGIGPSFNGYDAVDKGIKAGTEGAIGVLSIANPVAGVTIAAGNFIENPNVGDAATILLPVVGKTVGKFAGKYVDDVVNKFFGHADDAPSNAFVEIPTAAKKNACDSGTTPGKYTVGIYDDIRGTVPGLDAHHVGQKKVMADFIPDYNPTTAPAILVPKVGHTIRGPNGIVSRSTEGFDSARDVITRDIRELRRVYPSP